MKMLPKILHIPGRVIDVGANRGVYAYPLSKLCSNLELFEPNPQCAEILQSWASSRSNVQVHPVALSDVEGFASLRVPVDTSGVEHDSSASIEIHDSGGYSEYQVRVVPLDQFGFQNVVLIKIDVEGHEHRVIQGARHTIVNQRPALLVEIEQRHHIRPISGVFDQITSYDYVGFFLAGEELLSLDEFDLTKHQHITKLGGSQGDYVNNFLFLNRQRLMAGDYDTLIK